MSSGTSITTWIVTAIAVVVIVVLVVVVYGRVTSSLNALGTLQASGVLTDGKLQVTLTAVGGSVIVRGIVLLSQDGMVLYATGNTPGYSLYYPYYTWTGTFINGESEPTILPLSLGNGASATLVFTPFIIVSPDYSGSGWIGAIMQASQPIPSMVIIYYNNGKVAQASIAS